MKSKIQLIYVLIIGLYGYLVLSGLNTFFGIPTFKSFEELSFLTYSLILSSASWFILTVMPISSNTWLELKSWGYLLLFNGIVLHIVRQIELF